MQVDSLLLVLVVGALAGWASGKILKGRGFGIIGNMVVGVLGAVLGSYLFNVLGVAVGGLFGFFITATVGAIVLLFLVGLIKKA